MCLQEGGGEVVDVRQLNSFSSPGVDIAAARPRPSEQTRAMCADTQIADAHNLYSRSRCWVSVKYSVQLGCVQLPPPPKKINNWKDSLEIKVLVNPYQTTD